MALHSAGEIDRALEEGRSAVALAPDFADAHAYLGNTLVTRKRRFRDGLEAMDRAAELAPDDPAILYTAGWCHEYVANALERPRTRHQSVPQDAATLYAMARDYFLRALRANPDDQLRGDIEDMLDVVAAATGEPWEDEPEA
jgi:tetratricopeptide (TPR) repeat protein